MNSDVVADRKRVRFQVSADQGSAVFVAGDFNGWNPRGLRMRPVNGGKTYVASAVLDKGAHEYKFVVNGQWLIDPQNPEWCPNGIGSLNSVVKV